MLLLFCIFRFRTALSSIRPTYARVKTKCTPKSRIYFTKAVFQIRFSSLLGHEQYDVNNFAVPYFLFSRYPGNGWSRTLTSFHFFEEIFNQLFVSNAILIRARIFSYAYFFVEHAKIENWFDGTIIRLP